MFFLIKMELAALGNRAIAKRLPVGAFSIKIFQCRDALTCMVHVAVSMGCSTYTMIFRFNPALLLAMC